VGQLLAKLARYIITLKFEDTICLPKRAISIRGRIREALCSFLWLNFRCALAERPSTAFQDHLLRHRLHLRYFGHPSWLI